MKWKIGLLVGGCLGLLGLAAVASQRGWGVPAPQKKPISVREGSARLGPGHHRTRYFVGGGLHRGK